MFWSTKRKSLSLYAIILCWLALGIFGLIVQCKILPKPSEKEVNTEKRKHIDSESKGGKSSFLTDINRKRKMKN